MNRKIRQLRTGLIDLLNSYDLPIEVKAVVLSDTLQMVEKESDRVIAEEPIVEKGDLNNAEGTRRE